MDWNECTLKKLAKKVNIDEELAQSLLSTSENKLASQELLPLNDTTTNSKTSLAYDALRELLEALTLRQGYKIYNHECYTAFLNEILKESALSADFDDIRKIRNSINYYGKQITTQECEKTIKQIKKPIQTIKKKL